MPPTGAVKAAVLTRPWSSEFGCVNTSPSLAPGAPLESEWMLTVYVGKAPLPTNRVSFTLVSVYPEEWLPVVR